MKQQFGHLSMVIFASGILHADFVEEGICEGVVELQRNADQKRAKTKTVKFLSLKRRKRSGGKNVAEFNPCAERNGGVCGSVRL